MDISGAGVGAENNNFGSSTLLTVLYLHQPDNRCSLCEKFQGWLLATNQCCGARAASFRVEPEPIFYLAGAESRSRIFLASKKGKPCVVTKQFITVNVIQKKLALIIHFLRTQNEKC